MRARQGRAAGSRPRPTAWREFVVYDFPQVCRARVLTAPGMRRQAGDLRARQGRAAGSRPRPTGRGNGDAPPGVRGKIKLHGQPAGRPYDLTGIGICDFVRNFRKAVGRGQNPALRDQAAWRQDRAARVHSKSSRPGRGAAAVRFFASLLREERLEFLCLLSLQRKQVTAGRPATGAGRAWA